MLQRLRGTTPLLLACGLLLAPVGVAFTQDATGAAQPDQPDQVAELDSLFQSLVAQQGDAAYEPQNLLELSRLLASPCDQLLWLGRRIAILTPQPDLARQLAELAAQRAATLGDLLSGCQDQWATWIKPPEAARPKPIYELTDAAALQERLGQAAQTPDELSALSPPQKFALLSRGCDERLVFASSGDIPAWDVPRRVLDRLAGTTQLSAFWELRSLQQQLTRAHQHWISASAAAFGEPAQQQVVTASFQLAAALTDRALGLDRDLARLEPTVPYDDNPAGWSQLAADLNEQSAWRWATLAHVLAAAPRPDEAADARAVDAARAPWSDFRKLDAQSWAAVDASPDGWLARLGTAGRQSVPRMLPLAEDFLAPQREQRRGHETEILKLVEGAASDDAALADRVFQAIQRAKSAELGAGPAISPLTLAELTAKLGGEEPWVYLFVELIELRSVVASAEGAFCGVALYRERYVERMEGRPYTDKYVARIVPLSKSAELAVTAALDKGPPAERSGQPLRDARILIAPDGPLPASWFDFEKTTLLPRTGGIDRSWIVYLPTATALTAPAWNLDGTLRVWYRSAVPLGAAAYFAATAPPLLSTRALGPALDRPEMTLYLVQLDKPTGAAAGKTTEALNATRLAEVLKAKRGEKLPLLPLWVNRGDAR